MRSRKGQAGYCKDPENYEMKDCETALGLIGRISQVAHWLAAIVVFLRLVRVTDDNNLAALVVQRRWLCGDYDRELAFVKFGAVFGVLACFVQAAPTSPMLPPCTESSLTTKQIWK